MQVSKFLRKAPIERSDVSIATVEKFLECNRLVEHTNSRVTEMIFDGDPDLFRLKSYITETFQSLPSVPVWGQHGPGAVAEEKVKGIDEKFLVLNAITRFDRILAWYQDFSYTPVWVEESDDGSSASRLMCVPKTWKTLRTICAEPCTNQYAQQALKRCLYETILASPDYHVPLKHAEVNGEMAISGSRTGLYATIDLSSASDTVSYELVRFLFSDTPYGELLDSCRTKRCITPSGEMVPLSMFSSMGSAVSFPVECIIFASLCRRAVELTRQVDRSVPYRDASVYTVFGDDIIVHRTVVPALLQLLDKFGFIVNPAKSFWEGHYRESCGVEAYDGVDITPLCPRLHYGLTSLSRKGDPTLRMRAYAEFIDLANDAYLRNFKQVRKTIVSWLDDHGMILRTNYGQVNRTLDDDPWSKDRWDDSSFCLLSPCPTNFHLKSSSGISPENEPVSRIVCERPRVRSRRVSTESIGFPSLVRLELWWTQALTRDWVTEEKTEYEPSILKLAPTGVFIDQYGRIRQSRRRSDSTTS